MKWDRRAIACFDQALADLGLANDCALRQVLHDYFAWATTTTMSRYRQSAAFAVEPVLDQLGSEEAHGWCRARRAPRAAPRLVSL